MNPDALLYLLLLAVTLPTGHSMYQDDVKAWPCPNPEELVPCTCYADEDLNLFVDCQDLPNLETLQDVFDEKFPFKKFFRLQVSNSEFSNGSLTKEVFNGFSFREVIMYDNNLISVEPTAFEDSYAELSFFEFSDDMETFPLPGDMSDFTELHEVVMSVNCSSIPDLVSPNVISLSVRCWNEAELKSTTLSFTNLMTLHLHDSSLTTIDPDSFQNSPKLLTVTLNRNNLDAIVELNFVNLLELDLSDSCLEDMPHILGMQENGVVRISYNDELKKMNENNTLELINGNVTIEAEGVSLGCDCNLRWLLGKNDAEMYLNNVVKVGTDCPQSTNYTRNILNQFCG
ncbi:uncharacterized protein LOC121867251 [Homarus americanus]|uniref:uncharacterized protein LOC121867251 n=1 Tax=Homarus americanus TaxID=6706 RepID=UPI001C444BC9|nr:uncharacterized protein LOC121867251 [Homarus americanus]